MLAALVVNQSQNLEQINGNSRILNLEDPTDKRCTIFLAI